MKISLPQSLNKQIKIRIHILHTFNTSNSSKNTFARLQHVILNVYLEFS